MERPAKSRWGIEDGLKHESVINLDQAQTVDQTKLHHFVGTVGSEKMDAVCRALLIATGCGS
jgi:mRNA-degrading endonuclease toxin of MazEF toxin-antitoxin module